MLKNYVSFLFLLIFSRNFSAQCTSTFDVHSSDGYTVHVALNILTVLPGSNTCSYGYNYNLQFEYDITFSGVNIPGSLWTLQGHMPCGSETNNFFDLPNHGGKGIATTGGNIWRNESDCATATPMSLGCSTVKLSIQGPGINSSAIMVIDQICDFSASSLPIELVSFTATKSEKFVDLSWTTSSELNNSHFEILKSEDGRNWEVIGTVQGAGTSTLSNSYTYQDKTVNDAQLVYYRLRQVDFDGAYSYSDIQSVLVDTFQWSLVPNPAKEISLIQSSERILLDNVQIYDFTGRLIPSAELLEQINENQILIHARQLNPGVYMILVNGSVEKLVVE